MFGIGNPKRGTGLRHTKHESPLANDDEPRGSHCTSYNIAMDRRTFMQTLPAAGLIGADVTASAKNTKRVPHLPASAVYELRVYHCYEGKLPDLLARFRDHTMSLFEKHGMTNVAYWTPTDDPLKGKTLFYAIAHASREAATANWQAFRDDPEWKSVQAKSEASGKLVEKIDSTFLMLTDFSPRL